MSLWERFPALKHLSPRRRSVMRGIMKEGRRSCGAAPRSRRCSRGGPRSFPAASASASRSAARWSGTLDVFLMDEPLSNLDAKLRVHMRSELDRTAPRLGHTFIYVTHDQVEAMTMSAAWRMMDGGLIQLGTPFEVYARPADLRVAQFIGTPPINLLPGIVDTAGAPVILGQRLPFALGSDRAGERSTIGIRPEDTVLDRSESRQSGQSFFDARIVKVEDHGADLLVHCASCWRHAPTAFTVRVDAGESRRCLRSGPMGIAASCSKQIACTFSTRPACDRRSPAERPTAVIGSAHDRSASRGEQRGSRQERMARTRRNDCSLSPCLRRPAVILLICLMILPSSSVLFSA